MPVLLPGKSQGQRSLAGYSPWDLKGIRHDLTTKQQQININTPLSEKINCLEQCSPVPKHMQGWRRAAEVVRESELLHRWMYTSQVVFSLGLKNVTTGEFAVYWQMLLE